ncbi:MAG: hypothetical protein J6A01_10590 [Proteobacteria bacterium]|nr:hypothetical protein [Pseudomonadota bacterium]
MDIALYKELVNHAQKCGADDAALVYRHSLEKSNSGNVKSVDEIKLAVQFQKGSASAFFTNRFACPDRTALLQITKNLCQAAKIANAWGQPNPSDIQSTVQAFNQMPSIQYPEEACDPLACTDDCYHANCLQSDFWNFPAFEPPNLNEISNNLSIQMEQTTKAIDEALFYQQNISLHTFVETSIKSQLKLQHIDDTYTLSLPLCRFNPLDSNNPLANPGQLQASMLEIADGFYNSVCAKLEYVSPMPNLVISGWGMAILGHEAAHLSVDMASSGKLIMDMAQCQPTPNSANCPIHALLPSDSTTHSKQELFEALPSHTLFVDAPSLWVRRNNTLLDVHFKIACEIENAKILRYFKPVTLRFDLKNIWQNIHSTTNLISKVCLKCHHGMADFSAPDCYLPQTIPLGKI